MAGSYWEQQVVRLYGRFYIDDVLTDPTTVTLYVIDPDGNTDVFTYAAAEVIRLSQGVYYHDYLFDAAETWYYIWIGTGTVGGVDKQELYVEALGI